MRWEMRIPSIFRLMAIIIKSCPGHWAASGEFVRNMEWGQACCNERLSADNGLLTRNHRLVNCNTSFWLWTPAVSTCPERLPNNEHHTALAITAHYMWHVTIRDMCQRDNCPQLQALARELLYPDLTLDHRHQDMMTKCLDLEFKFFPPCEL